VTEEGEGGGEMMKEERKKKKRGKQSVETGLGFCMKNFLGG